MLYSVGNVVQYVSEILRDQTVGREFTVWKEPFLVNTLQEGLCAIAARNSSAMLAEQTLTLSTGMMQQLPEKYEQFSVVCQEQPLNLDIVRAPLAAFKSVEGDRYASSNLLTLGSCESSNNTGWMLEKWGWDKSMPNKLFVSPPVPNDGKSYQVLVQYTGSMITPDGDFTLDRAYYPALVSWMIYRALSASSESQSHVDLAATHLNHFKDVFGIGEVKQASR